MPFGVIYKTTNIITGDFYIGQSTKTGRSLENYLGSGIYLKRAIEKYGKENFVKEILEYASSKEELDFLEIEYISEYKPAYNIAIGGQGGNLGEAVNVKKRGKLNPMFGNTHSKEIKDLLRKTTNIQFKLYGHPRSTRVICIEKSLVFSTIQEAAKKLNLNFSHIGSVCRKERKTTGGLHFLYESEYINLSKEEKEEVYKEINLENEKRKRFGYHGKNSVSVVCLETREKYISISEAAKLTGSDNQGIYDCCAKRRLTSNKLHWMYYSEYVQINESEIVKILNRKDERFVFSGKNPYVSKKVLCVETGIEYESAMDAARETGVNNSLIGKCANGKLLKAGKFSWKWILPSEI